ncbi:CynX/NimT family MFS transporter [Albimonas pacifica]|uniref:MFS transporter, CP family, cyanate transporter n=1 Tax=Albimonas pacifica TaxID=1114924 RepID=A0A1I3CVK7_9RHOB|nr:MFS transporter [Albimonas pacifica]SFH78416.1 MFS transporter, CP family, cyanate transporter [Albimonas pacifica]
MTTRVFRAVAAAPGVMRAGRPGRPPLAGPAAPGPLAFGVAVVCLVLVALGLRPGIVSIGPILPSLIAEFGLLHMQASLLTAIPTLLMGLLAPATPWLASRFGRDRAIAAALALIAVATVGRAFAGSTGALLAATAGVGVGIAIAGALVPPFVKATFPKRVALLMGVYAMALSVGGALAAAGTGLLAQVVASWRAPAGVWAAPALIGAAAWLVVEARGRAASGARVSTPRPRLPAGERKAWLIAVFFALNNMVFYSCVSWIAPLYVESGRSPASAGLILSCFTVAFMAAPPLFGAISRSDDRRAVLALASALSLAGMIWLAVAPGLLPFAAVSLVGAGAGGAFTLAMTLPLDNADTDAEATAWNAFAMFVSYIVGAAGPLLVGSLRDAAGDYTAPLWMLVGLSVAMLAVTPFLQPRRRGGATPP